MSRQWKIC